MCARKSAACFCPSCSGAKFRGLKRWQVLARILIIMTSDAPQVAGRLARKQTLMEDGPLYVAVLLIIGASVWVGSLILQVPEWGQAGSRGSSQVEARSRLSSNIVVRAVPDSPVHWAMLHGFAEPESDGTWIVALEGALEFEVPDGVHSLLLELYPYLPSDVEGRTLAIRSGERVQLVNLRDGITIVPVPVEPSSRQRVSIECDGTVSPFVLGEGPDKRTLCVKLLSVEAMSAS